MKDDGFTLVELMITLTVLAILIAVGVPGFTQFTQSQRTTTQMNQLVGHIALARSEALERAQRVALITNDGTWGNGYRIRVDSNSDGDYTDAGDELIRDIAGLELATLVANADPVEFLPSGRLAGNYQFTLLANNCKAENNRTFTITRTGIPQVVRSICP